MPTTEIERLLTEALRRLTERYETTTQQHDAHVTEWLSVVNEWREVQRLQEEQLTALFALFDELQRQVENL